MIFLVGILFALALGGGILFRRDGTAAGTAFGLGDGGDPLLGLLVPAREGERDAAGGERKEGNENPGH